jgi:hypothetical protein
MRWEMLRYHRRYRSVVDQLAGSRKRLYQDEDNLVLDLSARSFNVIPTERPDDLEGFVDPYWTNGNALIRNLDYRQGGSFLLLRTMGWHPYGNDAARLGLRVFAENQELDLLRTVADGFLFRVDPARSRVNAIRIVSETLRPGELGAGRRARFLGIDVRAIELGDDPEVLEQPLRNTCQPIAGLVEPAEIWRKHGFFPGGLNWTDGDGSFFALCWPVPEEHRFLVLQMHRAHPFRGDLDRLGVRVMVNGIDLAFDHHEVLGRPEFGL